MKSLYLTVIIGVVMGVLLSILLGRGSSDHNILVVASVIFGCICLVITPLLRWGYRRYPSILTKSLYKGIGVLGALLISQVVSIPVGMYLHNQDLQEAKHFTESLIPLLVR
jgi:hypothetical protein